MVANMAVMPRDKLELGLYDELVDTLLEAAIVALPDGRDADWPDLDAGERHVVLAAYVSRRLADRLKRDASDAAAQARLCNRLLQLLTGDASDVDAEIPSSPKLLREVAEVNPGQVFQPTPRPVTELRHAALFTSRGEPNLLSELKLEMMSADRVDLLCSFIKSSGVNALYSALDQAAKRGAAIRVLTTSYMGATDPEAVARLAKLKGIQIRVSYQVDSTRHHAKAWVFHRKTHFGSAWVGSANVSTSALAGGLEWVVKLSQNELPYLWEKVTASFDTLWEGVEFEEYDANCDGDTLREAVAQQRAHAEGSAQHLFDIRPYPFQQEILDRIQVERKELGRNRHLVVAATGTGKTIIAAFDYKAFAGAQNRWPRMMFVAHRKEILEQALQTFRQVLRDQNFGELALGGSIPRRWDHIFVSIQQWSSWMKDSNDPLLQGGWEYVVVDEFHHAEAPSYVCLLERMGAVELLGLTATPERADLRDVRRWFNGEISAELRLPDAINRGLLAPFNYFGITDCVNYSRLKWVRGGYSVTDLADALEANRERAALVMDAVKRRVVNPDTVRGIGFCVGVKHAKLMADSFQEAGVEARVLTGETPAAERDQIRRELSAGSVRYVFTVDVYNEGVDIPDVDTVLFLRPTESLTIFLQQLGRGLRLCSGKESLTVLDFVGQQHTRFRYDRRFAALLTAPADSLTAEMDLQFPHLPAGCAIDLEPVARDHIAANIKAAIRQSLQTMQAAVREHWEDKGSHQPYAKFLHTNNLCPDDIYRRNVSYAQLCAEASGAAWPVDPDTSRLTKGLRRIDHISGVRQLRALRGVLARDDGVPEEAAPYVRMMHYALWGDPLPMAGGEQDTSEAELLTRTVRSLRQKPAMLEELDNLFDYQLQSVKSLSIHPDPKLPFELHAAYSRDEVLAGLGEHTLARRRQFREGVLYHSERHTDILFVTICKSEARHSASTMYEDYALSSTLFHWQSQSTTSITSRTGARYTGCEPGYAVQLFVREREKTADKTAPFVWLGPATYAKHEGSRPISILWNLQYPIPARLLKWMQRFGMD
ncbi:MAG: DUF3427 domain-containing protein [Armatimonadetes bacterium]|nr:DUF3427 domain-containing protein [Armatimonadota bacterium]MDE2207995.1 DUF3427 domain-containing protein [Armatimonadota bacterium]